VCFRATSARWTVVLAVLLALAAPTSASASKGLVLGLFDDAVTLDEGHNAFPLLTTLHLQLVRMTLTWGGRGGVANKQPAQPADAALRYSGTFLDTASGRILPRVSLWLAWNEPNNPVFLQPQFTRVRGHWQMAAPEAYARICNAVYDGVHATAGPEQVGCGATAPRGSNSPTGARPSIAPLAFMRAAKRAGLRTFDAWAHHPYYGAPFQTPSTRAVGPHAVELGNIDTLIAELTHLYGDKPLWITEYGFETKPPDGFFGVSWQKQALYLKQAYEIARANPRIDLFTWFLLEDSPSPDGWQSGLIDVNGRHKPAFGVLASLRGAL
jgi:hypothetical protein